MWNCETFDAFIERILEKDTAVFSPELRQNKGIRPLDMEQHSADEDCQDKKNIGDPLIWRSSVRGI